MYPTEDELRQALSSHEPSDDFTARVMDRVRAERRVTKFPLRRWSIIGAVAASLTIGMYVRRQQQGSEGRAASVLAAQQAEQQLLDSLQMAGWQINKAREAVLLSVMEESQ